ncbi:hypothetical protein D9M73_216930 [compost metagenome]
MLLRAIDAIFQLDELTTLLRRGLTVPGGSMLILHGLRACGMFLGQCAECCLVIRLGGELDEPGRRFWFFGQVREHCLQGIALLYIHTREQVLAHVGVAAPGDNLFQQVLRTSQTLPLFWSGRLWGKQQQVFRIAAAVVLADHQCFTHLHAVHVQQINAEP